LSFKQRRRIEPDGRLRQDAAGFIFDSAKQRSGKHLGIGQPGDEYQSEHDGRAEEAMCSHRSVSFAEWHNENVESFAVRLPCDNFVTALDTHKRKGRAERVIPQEKNAEPVENESLGLMKR
jgi:hypothetical protein